MPTLELILLGTGSPIHQPHRSGNAQIIRGGDANVLIDAPLYEIESQEGA